MDLKTLREKAGMSQAELAKKAGVSQSNISYLERGEKSPTINTVIKLANALQIEIVDLIRLWDTSKL